MKYILIACFLTLISTSCKKKVYQKFTHDPTLYSRTVHELNQVVMGNNFPPVVASRNYAYAAIAGYEAIAGGYPKAYQSLKGQLNDLDSMPASPVNKKGIDFELAALLAYCTVGEAVTFPEGSMKEYIDSIKARAADEGMPDDMLKASADYAAKVAAAILKWSKKDHYLQTRSATKYSVLDTPGRWVPTPPMYASALEMHWAELRPMAMDSAKQFLAPPPFKFDMKDTTSDYYKQVVQIKRAVDSLTPEQKHIAEFWDDNPFKLNVSGHVMFGTKKFSPPGHWMGIIGIAAQKSGADFATTVYAYAKTAITMFDAFIQCWQAKYTFNTARPETVINKYLDPDWRPFLQTPPFPEYTCGHSTTSSAAAETLTGIFGDNFAYTDTTELEFGIKSRSFASFRAAADENNWARFYGGIHFHPSCIVSTEYGRKVGDYVKNKLVMKK
jgi:hypothetical protein